MSKVIFQFANGVLTVDNKLVSKPTEKRNLGLDEQPANPYAEGGELADESSVKSDESEEGKPAVDESPKNAENTDTSAGDAPANDAPAADAKATTKTAAKTTTK